MEYKNYYIKKEVKLSKLLEKLGVNREELKTLNPNIKLVYDSLFGKPIVSVGQNLKLPFNANVPIIEYSSQKNIQETEKQRRELLDKLIFNETARYRGEQNIITKFNDIIQTTVDTKQEYLVSKTSIDGIVYIKIELVEDIIKSYPESLAVSTKLLTDIDLIKCQVIVSVNENGKIENIINYKEVITKWENHKQKILDKYSFIRMPNAKKNLEKFIDIQDQMIFNEVNLIKDLHTKMFFNVFFNDYLVKKIEVEKSVEKTFYSPLFEEQPIIYKLNENLVAETEDIIKIRKVTETKPKKLNKDYILKSYNQKFKPYIGYSFSEYKFSYRETTDYNEKEKWIKNANVSIIEEVKNNVQLLISYKLKKVEV